MTAFARFTPRLQQAIVSRLGWSSLRPVQEEAGAALLAGDNAVILAPTAGGKTEAAIFPVLSQLRAGDVLEARNATVAESTCRLPSELRATTTPRWVTTELNPVGAACTRSRPVLIDCTSSAAISCAGTCDVLYDDVLVGTASNSAPARTDE